MKSFRQIWRRPTRTLLGIMLITLASAVLCVCLGQSFAASVADKGIDEKYITVAFPSDTYGAQAHEWATAYARDNPDIITSVSSPVLASAFIGGISHDNFTDQLHYTDMAFVRRIPYSPYDRAVFEITLTEIEDRGIEKAIKGEIKNVIALEGGYSDPTGFSAQTVMIFPSDEAFAESGLEIGGRYLFCARSYVDNDYLLRNALSQAKRMELFDAFDHSKSEPRRGGMRVKYGTLFTMLYQDQLAYYRNVEFVTDTETHEGYNIPSYVRLEGSAEEFLASDAGAEWKQYIDDLKISYNTFPIIGVDDLMHLSHFARGNAEVIEGEAFTAEELAGGAKVCLISETLALKNGISVGDTLDLSYYEKDEDYPGEKLLSQGEGVMSPASAIYNSDTTPLGESEGYTVVGIYRKGDAWSADDFQNFSPNTVFVPKNSISSDYEEAFGGLFTTFILKNGSMEDFAHTVADAGFDEAFLFDDSGYGDMKAGIEEYGESTNKIVPLGFAVWSVVIALFLMLYPARQGKELDTMDSLGCTRAQRMGFVLSSSLAVLIPGSILGLGAGIFLWKYVTEFLTASIGGGLSIGVDISDFIMITLAGLALSLIAVIILALPLTRTRGLDRRK